MPSRNPSLRIKPTAGTHLSAGARVRYSDEALRNTSRSGKAAAKLRRGTVEAVGASPWGGAEWAEAVVRWDDGKVERWGAHHLSRAREAKINPAGYKGNKMNLRNPLPPLTRLDAATLAERASRAGWHDTTTAGRTKLLAYINEMRRRLGLPPASFTEYVQDHGLLSNTLTAFLAQRKKNPYRAELRSRRPGSAVTAGYEETVDTREEAEAVLAREKARRRAQGRTIERAEVLEVDSHGRRKKNPSRTRDAELAHALFGGPRRKVTKRLLKGESVGYNGLAVKVVKYGKDQTVVVGTKFPQQAVPTAAIEDIPNWEWQNRWDKQFWGPEGRPLSNPRKNLTLEQSNWAARGPWKVPHVSFSPGLLSYVKNEITGKEKPVAYVTEGGHAKAVRLAARLNKAHAAKAAKKFILGNPSSHVGDIIKVRHEASSLHHTPAFEANYRVLEVSNDPGRARRPIKVASTTSKHGKKGAVHWISVDQIVKVVRRAR